MGATHQTLILDLEDNYGKKMGKVVIRADKIENSSSNFFNNLSGYQHDMARFKDKKCRLTF